MKFKGAKGTFILIILIFFVLGYYYYLSNRKLETIPSAKSETASAVTDILVTNIDYNYPSTPQEVVRYYSDISKCFYNEDYSEDELRGLLNKAMQLYDDELVAEKSYDAYLSDLKSDVASFKKDKIVISGYKVSGSMEVNYFKKDGRDCAGVYCHYSLRQGTNMQATDELYILRKDDVGRWKILGFTFAKNADT